MTNVIAYLKSDTLQYISYKNTSQSTTICAALYVRLMCICMYLCVFMFVLVFAYLFVLHLYCVLLQLPPLCVC